MNNRSPIALESLILEHHHHSPIQLYGATSASNPTLVRKSTIPIALVGGDDAYGTELQLTDGTVIESGSASKYMDISQMLVTAVSAANKPTVVEIYSNVVGAAVNCTFNNSEAYVVKSSHGLSQNNQIVFDSVGGIAELNTYTIYYVLEVDSGNFNISLTADGDPVAFSSNGTGGHYHKLTTHSLLTEVLVSSASTTSDSMPLNTQNSRTTCDRRLSIRAKSFAASTPTISCFLALHTYDY